MPSGEVVDPPHSLKATEDCALDQVVDLAALDFSAYQLLLDECFLINKE